MHARALFAETAPGAPRPPTYDEAFAAMTRRVRASAADGGACFVAEYGDCGDLVYIEEIEGGLMGDVSFFDKNDGALVSKQHYNIEHADSLRWDGPVQTCARKKARDLCEK